MKKRADIILYEKGLAESREKAKRLIMEGIVFIDNIRIDKPGEKIDFSKEITVKNNPIKYVSRGGLKLEKARDAFNLNFKDKVCIDIGASTGGFTECMLKEGAKKVFAIDVGYNQLAWKLRNDNRVVVMERTNIRNVTKKDIYDQIDFISIDVSFISLRLVLPIAKNLLSEDGKIVALVKPQFEAGRDKVGKKGIIRDEKVHSDVLEEILRFSKEIGLIPVGLTHSPITGAKGNIEFLLYLKKKTGEKFNDIEISKVVDKAHGLLK